LKTYESYYRRAYEKRQNNLTGFKRVLGATGLGKSYGISLFIQWLRTQDYADGLVYTTHRHNLLGEMEGTLDKAHISHAYLLSNEAIAVSLTANEPELKRNCDDLEKRYDFFSSIGKDVTYHILKLAGDVQLAKKSYEFMTTQHMMEKEARNMLNRAVSDFFRVFKDALRMLYKNDKLQHETLMKEDGFLWQLFPYIKFLYAIPRPVLLVTMDKLLDGFFDGLRMQYLADLSKNIIFIDEFEHQEKIILSHLCDQPNMNNMFEFVRQFRTKVEGYTENIKSVANARKVLDTYTQDLGRLAYPELYDFMMESALIDKSEKIIIFQSRRLTSTYNFLIKPEAKAWRIVKNNTPQAMRSRPLLYLFDRTMKQIMTFFNILLHNQESPYNYKDWVESVFNVHNDNVDGKYSDIIGIYAQIPPLQDYHWKKTLANQAITDNLYFKGMIMYSLERKNYAQIPDYVHVTQSNLLITPELLWLRLCLRNLVFGLSATGDLPRVVNSFDVFWLEQLPDLFIPEDEADKELISEMITEKDKKRGGYDVTYTVVSEKIDVSMMDFITQFSSDIFGKEVKKETHVVSFVKRFLSTLDFVKKSPNQAHLVYMNSYNYSEKTLKLLLEKGTGGMGFGLRQLHGEGQYLITYNQTESCKIVFLDAERMAEMKNLTHFSFFDLMTNEPPKKKVKKSTSKSKQTELGLEVEENKPAEEDKIEYATKLLVVTQFATASLGVNLEWCQPNAPDKRLDFEGLHILNPFMYYFDTDKNDFNHFPTKNFWKLNKLRESVNISDQQFEIILKQPDLFTAFNDFNFRAYRGTRDYKYNVISLMEQVLGRLERQRNHAPMCYEVRVCEEVNNVWEEYLTAQDNNMAIRRNDRESYLSPLIRRVYAGVLEYFDAKQWSNLENNQRILKLELACKHDLDYLVTLIREMREGLHAEHEWKIINMWTDLRRAMLLQDYCYEPDFKLTLEKTQFELRFRELFVFQSHYIQADDSMWVDREYKLVNCIYQENTNLEYYSLNQYYRYFASNPVITQHFEAEGYPIGYYKNSANYVFTPYAAQSILAGALGEEAVKALLRHEGVQLERLNYQKENWQIYELSDMKVLDKPIYIDAKNFSEGHLNTLQANDEEAAKLLRDALLKRNTIAQRTQDERTKYVVINVQINQDHPANYFDTNGNRVNGFQECALMIIQGCFDPNLSDEETNKGKLLSQFALFIDEVKNFEESSHE